MFKNRIPEQVPETEKKNSIHSLLSFLDSWLLILVSDKL